MKLLGLITVKGPALARRGLIEPNHPSPAHLSQLNLVPVFAVGVKLAGDIHHLSYRRWKHVCVRSGQRSVIKEIRRVLRRCVRTLADADVVP